MEKNVTKTILSEYNGRANHITFCAKLGLELLLNMLLLNE